MKKNYFKPMLAWFDTNAAKDTTSNQLSWDQVLPFLFMHLAIIGVFWVGFSWIALCIAVSLYFIRMFAITAFYHRYFSHKHFKTSRLVQAIFAFIGASAAQRGPLWWASHHRQHHSAADQAEDPHSPRQSGFLWSHTLWFLSPKNFATREHKIQDFAKYPELKWLDRFDIVAPISLVLSLYLLGLFLNSYYPDLNTSGGQLVIWGFFISTVVLYHATYTINSLAHKFGTRRFETKDDSRNNMALAIITLGEGWHNNHHYYSGSVRQGFVWWEIDMTFYLLKLMSWLGLVWDLKPIPQKIRQQMKQQMTRETL